MSIFSNVQTQTAPSAPKGIIYGPPGIGKTTFGATPANSLIIDCENGAGNVMCQRTPYLATWPEISEWLTGIEREQHPYQVVAIDSLDWMIRRLEEQVSGCSANTPDKTLNKSHGGYGNGKQVLKNYLYGMLLPQLNRIVDRGIALILLAHALRTKITDIDGVTTEKTSPDIPDDYLGAFVEWSDFVCLARMGANSQRILITDGTERAVAKNRYGMPPAIPFDWNSFIASVGNGMRRNSAYNAATVPQEEN